MQSPSQAIIMTRKAKRGTMANNNMHMTNQGSCLRLVQVRFKNLRKLQVRDEIKVRQVRAKDLHNLKARERSWPRTCTNLRFGSARPVWVFDGNL